MKILVPIKRVIDPYAKVKPLPDGSGIDVSGVKFDVNPFDEIAVEQAVRMKEADGSWEIVAVSIGSAECEEQLRKALAMGADRAILVEREGEMDSTLVAKELEAVVQRENPDVILMGKQSTDGDCNQVGQMLAARLDWPQATFAAKVTVTGGSATVTRETDTGEEVVSMPLPCLITVDLRLNEPRYIALPGIIKARSKPLDKVSAAVAGSSRIMIKRFDPVPTRSAGKKVANVDELVAEIVAKGVLG
jgi:electron transfer flavoprotein beta subunit